MLYVCASYVIVNVQYSYFCRTVGPTIVTFVLRPFFLLQMEEFGLATSDCYPLVHRAMIEVSIPEDTMLRMYTSSTKLLCIYTVTEICSPCTKFINEKRKEIMEKKLAKWSREHLPLVVIVSLFLVLCSQTLVCGASRVQYRNPLYTCSI